MRSFKLRFQNTTVGNTAKNKSVAELKAIVRQISNGLDGEMSMNPLFEKYANLMTAASSPQVVLTVGSHRIFTFLQRLNGRTADAIFPASWMASTVHSVIWYAFFVPITATRYIMNEERAMVVLRVIMGI